MQAAAHTLSVDRVEEGGPSARAGLQPGELVLAIDGVSTHDMTESELRERVRGDVGTFVVLRVRRPDGRERDVRIERGP
jgi:carboxyl-terminal processing protease